MKMHVAVILISAALVAGPAMAQTPPAAAPPSAQAAPAPELPFPEDARIAFVDLQAVFAQSAFGRDARTRLQELQQRLNVDLQAKVQEREGLSQKIQSQQGIVTDAILNGWVTALRRVEREAQFAQQEAQIQVEELQAALIGEFEERVLPLIEALRVERNLLAVFSVPAADDPAGGLRLVAADRGLNLSAALIRRLDGAQ